MIVVDWANGAKGPNYIQAAANTRVVGAQIASLILAAESLGYSASRFHIIGHSLGAHIGGYAGQYLKSRLGRITGKIYGLLLENASRSRLSRITDKICHTDCWAVPQIQTEQNLI